MFGIASSDIRSLYNIWSHNSHTPQLCSRGVKFVINLPVFGWSSCQINFSHYPTAFTLFKIEYALK